MSHFLFRILKSLVDKTEYINKLHTYRFAENQQPSGACLLRTWAIQSTQYEES